MIDTLTIAPTGEIIIEPMSASEAQSVIRQVKDHAESIGRLLIDLDRRRGWEALGYASFTHCLRQEFEYSRQHLYRLMRAAPVQERVEQSIGIALSINAANALRDVPDDLQTAVVQAVIARGETPTAGRLEAYGRVFTQAATTGYVDVGPDARPTPFDAALTDEALELKRRQEEHMRKEERVYLLKAESVTTRANGDLYISGDDFALPEHAQVFVSVWIVEDAV